MELTAATPMVFITGLHRSGTSYLHRVLRDHPELFGLRNTEQPEDEGQHVQDVLPTAAAYGGPGQFAFAAEAGGSAQRLLLTSESQQRLCSSWARFAEHKASARMFVEKSPSTMLRMPLLQGLFPGAKFICLVRHPIPTSLSTKQWTNGSLQSLCAHWFTAYRHALEDFSQLDSLVFIRYEDLLRTPAKVLTAIQEYLALENNFSNVEPIEDENQKWLQQWERHYRAQQKSLQDFTPEESRLLRDFGYSLEPPYVRTPQLPLLLF